jgi:alkylated DNA repair protein (DNA oxidative demethylase)
MTAEPPVTTDLFAAPERTGAEPMAQGAVLLHGFALSSERTLLEDLQAVLAAAPCRHMVTPGGHRMSVAMTNCGAVGWVTDQRGYRYQRDDPLSARPGPALPSSFIALATTAAAAAGFSSFTPDACLVNRYQPGARMGLHQDRDECHLSAPIVSVSLGLPATFLFGGLRRSDPARRFQLRHGDVAAWGGPSRLAFHGVAPLKDGYHPLLGRERINLTFRKAL